MRRRELRGAEKRKLCTLGPLYLSDPHLQWDDYNLVVTPLAKQEMARMISGILYRIET